MKNFKLFGGHIIDDVGQYSRDYLEGIDASNDEVLIYVGTDSKQLRKDTMYATVIAFYHVFRGAHIIYKRKRVPKVRDIFQRLYKEVEMTKEVAEYMHAELKGSYVFKWNRENIRIELGKERVHHMSEDALNKVVKIYNDKLEHEKLVTCDLDLNPNPYWKSNMVHDAGVGVIKAHGFRVRTKPESWAAMCAADLICK